MGQGAQSNLGAPPPQVIIETTPGDGFDLTSLPAAQSLATTDFDLRIRRARFGFWSSFGAAGAGLALLTVAGIAYPHCHDELTCSSDDGRWQFALGATGSVMFLAGAVGMLTSGIILARRKKARRRYERDLASAGGRRIQWDLEKSRLVF